MIYPLITPVNFGKETINELNLSGELKAKHMRGLSDPLTYGQFFDIAASLAGVSVVVIDELSAEDASEVLRIISKKLNPGPATGGTT